ncbi:MAG TPA: hypothetical protein VGF12_01465 [Roseateles sp.]|uniref:hypothetical protein n=1 Tax=Roseateles sp. TaxID=1971397 RepID=UPI002ED7E6BD
MNPFSFQSRLALAAGMCLLPLCLAIASPGAHGPNGEHLDGPAAVSAGSGLPRIEAHSEQFEIVGRLDASSLVLYVSRYETNEAVLGAQLDVELGNLKARTAFEAEPGSYRLSDKKLVDALHRAGNHSLVFTLTAGADSDLLDGTLAVAAHDENDHAEGSGSGMRRGAAIVAGVVVLVMGAVLLRRRRHNFGAAR